MTEQPRLGRPDEGRPERDLDETDRPEVVLYWRPGCGFCHVLRRQLDWAGVERTEINIWEVAAATAVVRSHARGNETVPTVVIGGRGMVNPTAREVIAAIRSRGHRAEERTGSGQEVVAPAGRTGPGVGRGIAWGLLAVTVWLVLALTNQTTTYHFAPLVGALAWPVALRMAGQPADWVPGLVAAAWSAGLVVVGAAVLRAAGALAGPTLVGGSALVETAVMGGVGLVVALVLARPRRQ